MLRSEKSENKHRGQKGASERKERQGSSWKPEPEGWGQDEQLDSLGVDNSLPDISVQPHTLRHEHKAHHPRHRSTLVSDLKPERDTANLQVSSSPSPHLWFPGASLSPTIRKERYLQQQGLHLPASHQALAQLLIERQIIRSRVGSSSWTDTTQSPIPS